jgi:peptidyl-prolyl cis-trans isomerase C
MVDESFAKAAFALDTNTISDVVTTDLGYHLILVTDKRPGTPSFFEDPRIKEAARECYMEEMRQKLIADLRAKAKIEIK